jgi:transposase-like protein
MKQPIRWTRGEDRGDLGRHYSALLARQEASGLSMRRFAALHDVSACTLYQWKRRLAADRDAQTCEGGRLLAVDVVDEGEARTRENTYEISFADGTCLRVPRDFDAARVAELVAVVR